MDGTKIKGNASAKRTKDRAGFEKWLAEIEKEIAAVYYRKQKRSVCTKAKVRELLIDMREPLLQKMREKLMSDTGKRKYFMRQYLIEPVFGHLKFNVGYRNFLLRGLEKVRAEFQLMCIGWNLKKMLKLGIKPVTA